MTVEEKRQLELKTMRQIIGIYCHDKQHIVMRRPTEKKSVKSCATVARGCYYTLQFRLFVICI